jgi:putative transposase
MPGGTYHVFSRGSNRHELFVNDVDRFQLLEYTSVVVERYELCCLAFVFMTNHIHWLFRAPEQPLDSLSRALRDLNGTYSRRFNRRHGREAHAFRNRFGAVLQASEGQLLWTARYIVRNPVEAGLCAHPAEWPWSSYRATCGLAPAPPFLQVDALLSFFDPDHAIARAAYVDLVESPHPLDDIVVHAA